MGQRILICGDRNWINVDLIREIIYNMNDIEVIIEGECRGADILGKKIAQELNLPLLQFPADWVRYGRAAGIIRNQQMIDEGNPTKVIAFHNNIEKSKGTKDMINRAKKRGIKVLLISEWGKPVECE
jgi:hypothetical protein